MTDPEMAEHLEHVDGIQKAQMVALRLLLLDRPDTKVKLSQFADQLEASPPAEGMTAVQLQSMKHHLIALSKQ